MLLAPAALALSLVLLASGARAQEVEPRSYSNAPVGVNFLIAGFAYAEGGAAIDPSLPVTNPNLYTRSAILAYVRTLDLWGRSGKFDVIVPYGRISGSAQFQGQPQERDVSGLWDTRFRLSVNFYGAPALSLKEFQNYRQDTIVGASLQVSVPTGQYDSTKLVNNGTNRWSLKPELGVSKALGRWTTELAGGVTFYSDNDDFFNGKTREQDPIYSVQAGLIYNFPSGIWAAVNGSYLNGGRTTVDGVQGNDLQQNSRASVTLAFPVDRHNSVKVYASTGISIRTGGNYDLYSIAWQYRWGGGL